MIDFFIGKPPSMNRQDERLAPTIQQEVREALRLVRTVLKANGNIPAERRKNTRDRRREGNDEIIVRLSSRAEKRARLDRRQNLGFLNAARREREG